MNNEMYQKSQDDTRADMEVLGLYQGQYGSHGMIPGPIWKSRDDTRANMEVLG